MNFPLFPIVVRWPAVRLLAAGLCMGFIATGAGAQGGPSPQSMLPQLYSPLDNQRPAALPSLGDLARDRFPNTNLNPLQDHIGLPPKGPFFLPPLLPVLGTVPSGDSIPLADDYPREFAGEPFFMAEGNLAANDLLSDKRAGRLAGYRTARRALLTELRAELTRAPETAAARERALAELAAAQTPRLLELEMEAERIRHDLTHVELLKTAADDIGKIVPDKEDPKLKDALAAMRLILSAAHFQDGFSPDQRRLLEEMSQDIQLGIEPEPGAGDQAAVFFWPAGARIPVPAGLGSEAAAKFAGFQQRKTALKDELRDLLNRERRRVLNLDNTEDHARLAAAQAPRFAELDVLADEIRPALAALATAREHQNRQRDYFAAVLGTGLSPAQRRLLLATATVDFVASHP